MPNLIEIFKKKKEIRLDKINKAREEYGSFLEIYNSRGWKVWESTVEKKIENISKRLCEDSALDGDEMKKLQLALAVWREVKRLPSDIESKAKSK